MPPAALASSGPAGRVASGTSPAPAATVSPFTVTQSGPVAPGVSRRGGVWTTSDGPQAVELLDVNPATDGISFEVSRPSGGVRSLETVRSQAARQSVDGHRVVAAINGDVWSTDSITGAHAPIGVAIHRGEILTATRLRHPTLGFDDGKAARMADVAVQTALTLPDGITKVIVDRINKPRRTGDTILYSRRYGTSTATPSGGIEVVLTGAALTLRPTGTWTATVVSVGGTAGNTAIPSGALVVSADGINEAALKRLVKGQVVTLSTQITAGWETVREAIGGREWLREDDAVSIRPVSGFTTSAHPRTAVGLRADGSLVLAEVDGRQPGYSIGVRAQDLAELLGEQGAVDAIMLDGGGSSTALARLPGNVEAGLVNVPSDGRERRVANALFVVSSIPTGPLAGVVVRPSRTTVVVGARTALVAKGYDAAWNGIAIDPAAVSWSLDGTGGTLTSAGVFAAVTPGVATALATTQGIGGRSSLTTVPDTFAPAVTRPTTRLLVDAGVTPTIVPVRISWPAATDVGSGVASYELRRRVDGGSWESVSLATPTTRSLDVRLPTGHAFAYQVRATDKVGNVSAWATAPAFSLRYTEDTSHISYSSGWRSLVDSTANGGSLHKTTATGATASYTFTGSQVAWVAPRGTTRGKARVYLDGHFIRTVDLHRTTTQARRAVFTYAYESIGKHRLTVKVLGTAGHPRVDVDGMAVLDPASGNPVLLAAGDLASCSATADAATASLAERVPGTVAALGDIAYDAGTPDQLTGCYGPTWGRVQDRTRPVPGERDYATSNAAPYFETFGAAAGTAGQGWYAYDMGAWRVYALNSNCTYAGGCSEGSAQLDWLKADLAAHPRACVAAYWHAPLFSSGTSRGTVEVKPFWDVLNAAGAELVINAHDTDYERFAPQTASGAASSTGIREFVAGTGGAALGAFGTTAANSQVRKAGVAGLLKLELKTTGYTWAYLPADGSAALDSGSAACH